MTCQTTPQRPTCLPAQKEKKQQEELPGPLLVRPFRGIHRSCHDGTKLCRLGPSYLLRSSREEEETWYQKLLQSRERRYKGTDDR